VAEVGSMGEAREDCDGFEKREDKRESMVEPKEASGDEQGHAKGQRDRDGVKP